MAFVTHRALTDPPWLVSNHTEPLAIDQLTGQVSYPAPLFKISSSIQVPTKHLPENKMDFTQEP